MMIKTMMILITIIIMIVIITTRNKMIMIPVHKMTVSVDACLYTTFYYEYVYSPNADNNSLKS